MQGLPDTLRKQDLMSQSLLPKCHSTTCDNHHLPALILQHGHLTGYIKAITLKYFFHNQDQEPTHYYAHTAIINRVLLLCASTIFSRGITCSTMEASRPSARPHSSRVTTALPSFTTIRLACFNSLRWTKDFPWGRGSETTRKNKVTFNYTSACKNLQFSIQINKDGENIFCFRQDDKSRLAAYI